MIDALPHTIVIHHSAYLPDMDRLPSFEEVQLYHTKSKRWREIAYNLWVARDGELRMGRYLGDNPAANSGYNGGTIAICAPGWNGHEDKTLWWNDDQERVLRRAVKALRDLFFVRVENVVGHNTYAERVGASPTACPGMSDEELRRILWL
jgi:hypothetical protein